MSGVGPSPSTPSGAAGPKAHLRWAGLADLEALCAVYQAARPGQADDPETMAAWLEHGGAILLESEGRAIAALRWREESGGWRVDPAASLPEERAGAYGRWLMTKVEALAIRSNIPTLTLDAPSPEALPYYHRLGYRRRDPLDADSPLVKRVGGTWQVQEGQR